ncbi:hypothetical protein Q7M76_05030 [Candidatus Liberibacter asiaticus]|uniref:Uncharacterized protein n=2 Tax=Liberibacter asiaticus TaxID=34021 RepID=C6XGU1_LIBAP|nr:hypothetical protein [Candidatus Liberibacter asiaticus]ACT57594.1 hypothetical protein CLIBASIA_05115 [Candidatus Liberibacter asiaticus str. psy62]AGH17357.1 hypothetical protein WSI_04945 [Candidatus Liberibacter asiaticus str. gxpsy]ALK07638.1 hypothetical protein CD16_05005 [Candidatus Liberibacter asiaticus]ASK53130.1 hypothetical protein B2I23_05070 [Candidatus Liberibacter asiaticus]AWL14455.1 hypothetical protein DIC79_05110 [Candidatus Liberibacter asiaticus]
MFLNVLKDFFVPRIRFLIVLMVSSVSAGYANASQPEPTLRNQFSRWSVYVYPDLNKKLCFSLSVPVTVEPLEGVRHGVNFFIISLKKEENSAYVSELVMDYPLDEEEMVSLEVKGKNASGTIFKMKSYNNRAAFEKRSQDTVLIEEMKRGKELVVSAKSKRGTNTRYIYSLIGLSDSLADIRKCN